MGLILARFLIARY